MLAHVRALGIGHPTLYQLEDAYQQLKSTGLLHLNQAELQKQADKQAQERARTIQARGGVAAVAASTPTESEDELYSMDMSELRRKGTPGLGFDDERQSWLQKPGAYHGTNLCRTDHTIQHIV